MTSEANPVLVGLLEMEGYQHVRKLPTGEYAGIMPMVFTVGLFVGLTETEWHTRFCYDSFGEAKAALEAWDGKGFPPGYWIKQKPENISGPKRPA